MITTDGYRRIADDLKTGQYSGIAAMLQTFRPDIEFAYKGKITPKERPRVGKSGRVFTPAKTKALEKDIALNAAHRFETPLTYPLAIDLTFYDKTTDAYLLKYGGKMGLVYHHKKDLDNMAKLVLDALNGVAFKDDRQVVDLQVRRRYDAIDGLYLRASCAGLSHLEFSNLRKFL